VLYYALQLIMFTAKELVDQRERELMNVDGSQESAEDDDKSDGVYLTYMLSNKNLSRDEIYSNVMEMLIAGTDTVSGFQPCACAHARAHAFVCTVVYARLWDFCERTFLAYVQRTIM
jgi:cytochrome P450